jgi:hypothetical protein
MVGAVKHIQPAGVTGVGVVDDAGIVAVEGAQPRQLLQPGAACLVVVTVIPGLDFFPGEGNFEIPIEIGIERRHPLELPSHALTIPLQLLKGCPGNRNEGGIPLRQVGGGAVVIVCPERTTGAALLPIRAEHEVINDQLPFATEQVGK